MKNIKKLLVCFSLCLIMGICIPVSVQAASCNHTSKSKSIGEEKCGACTYKLREIEICNNSNCKEVVDYHLIKGPYVRHNYYTATTPYKTVDGRTVKVIEYTCYDCGHSYSTSSIS